jgi:hypothetical protein
MVRLTRTGATFRRTSTYSFIGACLAIVSDLVAKTVLRLLDARQSRMECRIRTEWNPCKGRPKDLASELWKDVATSSRKRRRRILYGEGTVVRARMYWRSLGLQGEIAESLSNTVRDSGGLLTTNDLRGYKAEVRPAVMGTYLNRTIYTTHAPSSGPVLLSLLNTLEPLNLPEEGRTALNIHRFIEALKCASRDSEHSTRCANR